MWKDSRVQNYYNTNSGNYSSEFDDLSHTSTYELKKKISCEICFKLFKEGKEYDLHYQLHENDRPFCCSKCSKTFNVKINLIIHEHLMHIDAESGDLCCPICSFSSNRLSSYKSHLLIHSVEDYLVCNVCGNISQSKSIFDHHVRSVHLSESSAPQKKVDNSYSCKICSDSLPDIGKYRKHMAEFHKGELVRKDKISKFYIEPKTDQSSSTDTIPIRGSRKSKVECSILLQKMTTSIPKRRVFEKKRVVEQNLPRQNGKPICPYCKKTFKYASELQRHIVVHTKTREYVCEICDKSFTQRKSLLVHQQRCYITQKGSINTQMISIGGAYNRRRKFKCKYCKFATFNSFISYHWHLTSRKSLCSIYERHHIIQPDGRRNQKGKQLTPQLIRNSRLDIKNDSETIEMVQARRKKHIEEKRKRLQEFVRESRQKYNNQIYNRTFSCNMCQRAYQKKIHLNEHLKNVHSERTFPCDICNVSFANQKSLSRHCESRHENSNITKFFQCNICGQKFRSNYSLKRHSNMTHQNNNRYFSCPICSKLFNRYSNIERHILQVHESIDERPIEVYIDLNDDQGQMQHNLVTDPSQQFHQQVYGSDQNNHQQVLNTNYANSTTQLTNCQGQLLTHPSSIDVTTIMPRQNYYEDDSTYYSNLLNDQTATNIYYSNAKVADENARYYQLQVPTYPSENNELTMVPNYESQVQYTVLQSRISTGYEEILTDVFKCGYCTFHQKKCSPSSFTKTHEILEHVKRVHHEELQSIEKCSVLNTNDANQVYHCPHCSQISDSLYAIQVHIDIHEKSIQNIPQKAIVSSAYPQDEEEQLFTCNKCCNSLSSIVALHRHIDKKHPPSLIIEPYCCGLCGSGYMKIGLLITHIIQIHNLPQEDFDSSFIEMDQSNRLQNMNPSYNQIIPYQNDCTYENFEMNIEGVGQSNEISNEQDKFIYPFTNENNSLAIFGDQMEAQEAGGHNSTNLNYQYVMMSGQQETEDMGENLNNPCTSKKALDNNQIGDMNQALVRECKTCNLIGTMSSAEWKEHKRLCRIRVKNINKKTNQNQMNAVILPRPEVQQITQICQDDLTMGYTHQQVDAENVDYQILPTTNEVQSNRQQILILNHDFLQDYFSNSINDDQIVYVVTLPQHSLIPTELNEDTIEDKMHCQENTIQTIEQQMIIPQNMITNAEDDSNIEETIFQETSQNILPTNVNEAMYEEILPTSTNEDYHQGEYEVSDQNNSKYSQEDPIIETLYNMIANVNNTTNEVVEENLPSNDIYQEETIQNDPIPFSLDAREGCVSKLHQCPHCPSQFKYPSLLARHLKTHTGDRPFCCKFCGFSFNQLSAYKNHMATQHEKLRHIRCHVCGKSFNLPQHLKLHMLRKHKK